VHVADLEDLKESSKLRSERLGALVSLIHLESDSCPIIWALYWCLPHTQEHVPIQNCGSNQHVRYYLSSWVCAPLY